MGSWPNYSGYRSPAARDYARTFRSVRPYQPRVSPDTVWRDAIRRLPQLRELQSPRYPEPAYTPRPGYNVKTTFSHPMLGKVGGALAEAAFLALLGWGVYETLKSEFPDEGNMCSPENIGKGPLLPVMTPDVPAGYTVEYYSGHCGTDFGDSWYSLHSSGGDVGCLTNPVYDPPHNPLALGHTADWVPDGGLWYLHRYAWNGIQFPNAGRRTYYQESWVLHPTFADPDVYPEWLPSGDPEPVPQRLAPAARPGPQEDGYPQTTPTSAPYGMRPPSRGNAERKSFYNPVRNAMGGIGQHSLGQSLAHGFNHLTEYNDALDAAYYSIPCIDRRIFMRDSGGFASPTDRAKFVIDNIDRVDIAKLFSNLATNELIDRIAAFGSQLMNVLGSGEKSELNRIGKSDRMPSGALGLFGFQSCFHPSHRKARDGAEQQIQDRVDEIARELQPWVGAPASVLAKLRKKFQESLLRPDGGPDFKALYDRYRELRKLERTMRRTRNDAGRCDET